MVEADQRRGLLKRRPHTEDQRSWRKDSSLNRLSNNDCVLCVSKWGWQESNLHVQRTLDPKALKRVLGLSWKLIVSRCIYLSFASTTLHTHMIDIASKLSTRSPIDHQNLQTPNDGSEPAFALFSLKVASLSAEHTLRSCGLILRQFFRFSLGSKVAFHAFSESCLLYTSPSPRD